MTRSLGEIEALARKAARGAGRSWGMAEEAGRATRWLCARGLPGAAALAGLLQWTDGTDEAALGPRTGGRAWDAAGGALCPLAAGAALCDHGAALVPVLPLRLTAVAQPLLLLPFAAGLAEDAGLGLLLDWPGVTAGLDPGSARLDARQPGALTVALAAQVRLGPGAAPPGRALPCGSRGALPGAAAATLERLAARILAPDTPESRLGGAGAGLRDTD